MRPEAVNRGGPGRRSQPPLARFARSPKGSLTFLFVPLFVAASVAAGWQSAIPHVLAAAAGACLVDLIVVRLTRGAWSWPTSALLSGLIVAFILGVDAPWTATAATAALATVSKHVVRTRRGHVFNPAALALVASVLILKTGQSWWGALPDSAWPWLLLLTAGGAWLVDRLNKFPLVLAFLATSVGLFALVGLADPARVAEMFRSPFVNATLFLAFFMLTDPPTSPGRISDQMWVGVLAAVVGVVAQLAGVGQTYLLVGLLAGNLALAAWRADGSGARLRAALLGEPSPIRRDRSGAEPRRADVSAQLSRSAS